jgi:hypothetical protein
LWGHSGALSRKISRETPVDEKPVAHQNGREETPMFTRNHAPFFPLGGQSHNSSAYNADELASAVAGVLALGGNFLEAPVYWEQLEPEEGRFDFAAVEAMIESCRQADLALVVLWFGTWKNGEMRYAPEWVKTDRDRFARVVGFDGAQMSVLSSYCPETRAADERAFTALCHRLAELDPSGDTVIAVQVENEPGILGSDRDYSTAATAAAKEPLPEGLVRFLRENTEGPVARAWSAGGGRAGATWEEAFGARAWEFREAWSIASYIDSVAAAGRAVFDRPMYTNAWLGQDGWPVPGSYPAGGPVWRTIEIWKAATPHLETIAPDIYTQNLEAYGNVCRQYARPDNPLFIPESGANDTNALAMLEAIAEHGAVGFACFAVDSVVDLDGNLRDGARLFAASFAAVKSMLPLILSCRGTGRLHAVGQRPGLGWKPYEFERYIGMVPFMELGFLKHIKDQRHARMPFPADHPVYGLILEASPTEFYLAGHFHLHLVEAASPAWLQALKFPTVATPADFLSVEEGTLDDAGRFTPHRKRNGDEVVFGGFWCSPHSGVVRVRLNPSG